MSPQHWSGILLLGATLGWVVTVRSADPEPAPLGFVRIHVPGDRLTEVPLGTGRLVPLALADFEAALAALGGDAATPDGPPTAGPRRRFAASARYTAELRSDGLLAGRLEFDLPVAGDPAAAGSRGDGMPLGALTITAASVRTARGTGDALVHCRPDGVVIVETPEPGTYGCTFVCPRVGSPPGTVRLPLVPALVTTIDLLPPPGFRPVVRGPAAGAAHVTRPSGTAPDTSWRIVVGAVEAIEIGLLPGAPAVPPTAVWTAVRVRGRQADVGMSLQPQGAWPAGPIVLRKDPNLLITAARLAGHLLPDRPTADGRTHEVIVPERLAGRGDPLELEGCAPVPATQAWSVPLCRVEDRWAGGGTRLEVEPPLAVSAIETAACVAIAADLTGAWPLPPSPGSGTGPPGGAAVIHLESQGPEAAVRITLRDRSPQFDVARVTTVELAPGAVLGQAACDVRVTAGEAFEIGARIMPGWVIDAVEAIDRSASGEPRTGMRPRPLAAQTLDWRVGRYERGTQLRIALPQAATPSRGVGLRITGHRRGVADGTGFSTADMDMVRVEGESAESALVDFKAGVDTVVEISGSAAGWMPAQGRLAALVVDEAVRGRIRGGDWAPPGTARLVRRRATVTADVEIALTPGEGVLGESFAFRCRPTATPLDAVELHFSEPLGEPVAWSVDAAQGVTISPRRLDLPAGNPPPAETWLVEISPPVADAVTIRASRAEPFDAELTVPLAWVKNCAEQRGIVRLAGSAVRLRPAGDRLRELPPRSAPAERPPETEFSFTRPDDGPGPVGWIMPPERRGEARAWASHESGTCWCHESGRVLRETLLEIENRGRESALVSLAPGETLERILVDDAGIEVESLPGGQLRVPLPGGRSRLVVRSLARAQKTLGGTWVAAVGCSIDLPVLDRTVDLLLPPALVFVGQSANCRQLAPRSPAVATGFRRVSFTVADGRPGAAGFVTAPRAILFGLGMLAAAAVAGVSAGLGPRVAWTAFTLTAVAAAWLPPAPAAVSGAVAVTAALAGLRSRWRLRGRAVVGAILGLAIGGGAVPPAARAADAATSPGDPLRVFITTGSAGGMALVPEPLFRALAAAEATVARAAIRVLECRVTARTDPGSPWTMQLDLDADEGGLLTLDQTGGGRWQPRGATTAGAGSPLRISDQGADVRLLAVVAGRHQVELDLMPTIEWQPEVEAAVIRLPPAPQASLRVAMGEASAAGVACEVADAEGPFLPGVGRVVTPGAVLFDISRAGRVRLVRSLNSRAALAQEIRAAETVNEVAWRERECRVDMHCTIDAGRDILRSFCVRMDPRLEPVAATAGAAAAVVRPVAAGLGLVELPEPVRGVVRTSLSFRMPLTSSVGVFAVPGVWVDAQAEIRTIRLTAAPDLEAAFEPSPGGQPPGREGFAAAPAVVWRREVTAGGDGAEVRVGIRRRQERVLGTQTLAVDFRENQTDLRLDARFEGGAAVAQIPVALPPAAVVDRVAVVAEPAAEPEAAAPTLDLLWSRVSADRLVVVMQRPQGGPLRLTIDARLPGVPADRGVVPIMRGESLGDAPLAVTWRRGDTPAGAPVDVPPASPGPDYAFSTPDESSPPAAESEAGPPTAAPRPVDREQPTDRLLTQEVRLTLNDRGVARGTATFALVSGRGNVRLRLPPGARLFDVRLDGRQMAAVPRAAGTWDLPLAAAAWPRFLEVVFAGPAGPAPVRGTVVNAAPTIEGLEPPEVLWTLDPPPGYAVRPLEPARPLSPAAVATFRQAVAGRWRDAAVAAQAGADTAERDRLATSEPPVQPEAAADTAPPGRVAALVTTATTLACRLEPTATAATTSAWWSTAALVAGAAGWFSARRRPAGGPTAAPPPVR